jgi:ribosomal protein S18 acetylase RimI-like enzyme
VAELRPVTGADREFLLELYASTRDEELAQVDWEEGARAAFLEHQFSAQDGHYRSNYPGATLDVIEIDGERAGRLYVYRGGDDIRIMDIAVAPAFRGRGIGTGLLEALMAEARASGRTLSIHVEMQNPARSLYDRLGFVPIGEHGVYVLMKWRDGSARATVDEAPSGMDLA